MAEYYALTLIDSSFWIKLFILLGILILLMYSINSFFRKLFKIDKADDKYYTKNFQSHWHRRIDWTIRITAIALLFVGLSINNTRHPDESITLLEPWNLVFIMIILNESLRVFMQWKHIKHPRIYLFTTSRLILIGILFLLVLTIDFSKLLN